MDTYTYEQLAAHLTEGDADLEDRNAEQVEYFLSEMNDTVRQSLEEAGFIFDHATQTVTVRDDATCEEVRAIAFSIIRAYDDGDWKGVWSDFNLSGDDDVDYNGGYILIILDLIERNK